MKRVSIKNKYGETLVAAMEDPSEWIAKGIAEEWWGKAGPLMLHKDEPGAEPYNEADVLQELMVEVAPAIEGTEAVLNEQGEIVEPAVEAKPAVYQKHVKLHGDYSIEIEDISAQHALEQVIIKRKSEYPSPEEFMNAYFDGGPEALGVLHMKRLEIKTKYPKPGA